MRWVPSASSQPPPLTQPDDKPTAAPDPAAPAPKPARLTDTVVRGAGLSGAGYIVTQILTLGFYVVLARLASPQEFGVFTAGTMLVSIGMLFTESGMMSALIHREDRIDEAASTAVVAAAGGGLALSLIALAAAPLLGVIFDSSSVAEIAAVASGLLFLRSLTVVPESLLQRRFSFLRRVVIQPVGVVAMGIAAVIATSNGMGAWGILIGFYAAAATDVLLSWALVRWRPRVRQMSFAMWRELIRYGRHILGGTAVWRASDELPVVMIGRFVGTEALGQFRYGVRIIHTPFSLMLAGGTVIFPALARIRDDRERFRAAARRSLRLMCGFTFPLVLVLVPLAVPLAILIFGARWEDAGYAAMALSGMPVAATLVSFTSEVVKSDGRPDILPRMHGVTLVVGAIGMVALLPLDLIGIVVGFSIGWLGGGIYGMRKASGLLQIPLRELWGEVFPPALAALVMAGVLTPLEFLVVEADTHGVVAGLALIAAEAALGAVIYLGVLSLLAPATRSELLEVAQGMMRRVSGAPVEADPADIRIAEPAMKEGG